jgi:hypothetical protein
MAKIRVKIGQAEAEVEADPEHLQEAINLVPELLSKLPKTTRDLPEQKLVPETPSETLDRQLISQFPIVNLEKGDSLADVIGKFFSGPWGRDKRKLSDVRDALQSYGLNYPKQSVAVALLRLAKTTKLRRFKAEDGEYVYTSAINLPGVSHEGTEHVLDELAATSPS